MSAVKVYGTDWCPETQQTLSHLDSLGVPYEYINIDDNEKGAAWVRHQNDGKEKKPTVDIGGLIFTDPSAKDLEIALRESKLV